MTMPAPISARPQVLAPGQRSLPELTAEVQRAHGEVMSALANGAEAAIAAGRALMAAKAMLRKEQGHGYFEHYIALECRLGMRTAQIYMYLARNETKLRQLLAAKTQGTAYLSQGAALKLLSVGQKKRKAPRRVKGAA